MNEEEYARLRAERLSLCIGQIVGQLSELLNNVKTVPLTNDQIYKSLLDITKVASLQVHELYYRGNKPV